MLVSRTVFALSKRSHFLCNIQKCGRLFNSKSFPSSGKKASSTFVALVAASGVIVASSSVDSNASCFHSISNKTKCENLSTNVLMLGPTSEPSTKILFPRLCNGMTFTGCGVRIKYMFVKVYAVGTYMDPIAMASVKKESDEEIEKALMDPMYPRTIRIVMNRTLSMEKYLAAICEALEPRMNGKDLNKLEEFKKMNPPGDMVEGAEVQMTIRGDSLLYKNSAGAVSAIQSEVFCRAMCDVYYGNDPASPDHKEAVIKGVKKL